MAQIAGQKRKLDYRTSSPARVQKRQKSRDGRDISSQTADMALSATGELNIASFIKAREFEINALDKSMKKARKGLMSRAFQQVPRHMRRRTASHNIKKVPKRLRRRAAREMREDNTPTVNSKTRTPSSKLRLRLETAKTLKKLNTRRKTVRQKKKEAKNATGDTEPGKPEHKLRIPRLKKNRLAEPPKATSKFKKRQVNKTWLPTHLWHTKRAHMTRPTEPLWRMAIPLKPNEKNYRPTHRAVGSRGCVAWDTSYMATVECFGTEAALESMLKSLEFCGESWSGAKHKKWKHGSRFSQGWIYERDKKTKPIAPVTVLWEHKAASTPLAEPTENGHNLSNEQKTDVEMQDSGSKARQKVKLDRRIMLRIHPSAFHQFWLELMKVAKMQKPQVLLEDLRFEIGSILIQGPGSTEAAVGVVKPSDPASTTSQVWSSLAALSNPASLPACSMLAIDINDPRFNHPPKTVKLAQEEPDRQELNGLLVSWPLDRESISTTLFSHKARYMAGKSMLTQKAINRQRSDLLPGQILAPDEKDVTIPVILLAHRPSGGTSSAQGSWEILMPWGGVDAVWRSLMYYPLTTGNTPRFGCLNDTQQVAFEQSQPWFPGDFPGTEAGKAWDRTETEKRFDQWIRRPPSRRYAWHALDLGLQRKGELGRGWACDWTYLLTDTSIPQNALSTSGKTRIKALSNSKSTSPLLTQKQRKAHAAKLEEEASRRRNTSSPESDVEDEIMHQPKYLQLTPLRAKSIFRSGPDTAMPENACLATIQITLLTKGTACAPARIYRLPSSTKSSSATPPQQSPSRADIVPTSLPTDSGQRPTIAFFSTSKSARYSPSPSELRQRWLSLDPNPTASTSNANSLSNLPHVHHQKKLPPNRHNDPRVGGRFYRAEPLSHIRVFPKNAPREVTEMYGPEPAPKTRDEMLKDMMPLPNTVHGFPDEEEDGDESVWLRRHVPCPDSHDLIGFVTSGGYNLAEGRGTAIGAVWAQRVIEGWRAEDEDAAAITAGVGGGSSTAKQGKMDDAKQQAKIHRQRDRERHLCIVRNAGESIGRLGIWELC